MYAKTILRAADVCSILNISIPTFYRWVREGMFPQGIKYGPNCTGWERQTIEVWLASKKSASQQAAQ